jgi:uncharacterized protein (DUF2235 family)
MPKRIIVCCDGTWNEPDQKDRGTISPTNVFKFYHALKGISEDGKEQKAYYDQGVGTGAWRFFCGATGAGLSKNVRQAYSFIARTYDPGDEIYLLGFSRGAYTARRVGGMIWNCGILKKEFAIKHLDDAHELFHSRDKTDHPDEKAAQTFREKYAYSKDNFRQIKFIGVWDTVGSLGIPLPGLMTWVNQIFHKNTFHSNTLNPGVENAFHAMAADEKRVLFKPVLWKRGTSPIVSVSGQQNIEQVWFPGVHSNVGGGYQDNGLSDIVLEWMIAKAKLCGLSFDMNYVEKFSHPNYLGELRDSRTVIYKPWRPYNRVKGNGVNEDVHETLIERKKTDFDYKPHGF